VSALTVRMKCSLKAFADILLVASVLRGQGKESLDFATTPAGLRLRTGTDQFVFQLFILLSPLRGGII
jgi:hypothetical protein